MTLTLVAPILSDQSVVSFNIDLEHEQKLNEQHDRME